MEILVVGAGAMGRWFGTVLREDASVPVTISYLDTSPDTALEAADETDARAVTDDEIGSYDLVCIAVPIPAAADAIERYAAHATTAVVDLTGTMAEPIEVMREHAAGCERASLHPLFAPTNEPGNVPTVIDERGPTTAMVLETLRRRGNDVFETTANRHDELMETVQARTHTAVLAFALAADAVPDEYHTPISSELASLARQVTGGEGRVYADIQSAFDGAGDIAEAAREIADADPERFERLYDRAAFPEPADTDASE